MNVEFLAKEVQKKRVGFCRALFYRDKYECKSNEFITIKL
jgi:hypothetical protein